MVGWCTFTRVNERCPERTNYGHTLCQSFETTYLCQSNEFNTEDFMAIRRRDEVFLIEYHHEKTRRHLVKRKEEITVDE